MSSETVILRAPIPLSRIEAELSRQLGEGRKDAKAPSLRARLSNLVIFCNHHLYAEEITQEVPEIISGHPARVLLVVGQSAPDMGVSASLNVWCQLGGHQKVCSEQVTLRAGGRFVDQLPFAVRQLLIGDLPVNLWWAAPIPPPLAGPFLYDLAERAQQIIYDSIGWTEPAKGVAATGAWLAKFQRGPGQGPWRVASDLNWRRLKHWRRVLAQTLDPKTLPGALESITEVLVEHGPHAVVQAWELISWMTARLGWKVQMAKVEPGVEIVWQAKAAHGALRLRIHRLSEGPPVVRRVRVAYQLAGQQRAFSITADDEKWLVVVPEGMDAAKRTIAVQPASLADLVAQQLSNRERDPVFAESMAGAEVFARTVLG